MGSKPEVVISGIGGILPKSKNLEDYIDILLQNKNTAEPAKWMSDGKGNTLLNNFPEKRHQHFDASFFAVHHAQTCFFDPVTRLLMETTFEAIIDAGLNPAEISGRNIAVMYGSTVSEANTFVFDVECPGFGITGNARCMAANRVSYFFNINGPSLIVDENWTAGTQAVQDAVGMIEAGVCEAAFVGGSVLSTSYSTNDIMAARGIICKDGKTKPFTEQADGYCRGDGVIVLFLQRACDAKRNYASILFAETRFNGNNEFGYTGFDADFFEKFLRDCYNKSGIDPKDIAYLEADGCGLKHIDEMELAAVEKIFCKNRKTPLPIGSVKTNIGHTETVAGLSGLIKIIIAMETGILPAHLNFNLKNTKIPALVNGKLEVVTENRKWTGELAAINNFGLTPLYGHMIIRRSRQTKLNLTTDLPFFVYYSTRTEEGITKINEKVLSQSPDFSYSKLVQDVFSKTIPGHLYRGYTVKGSQDKQGFQHFPGIKPPVWFVYSGMGSQWNKMGQDLLKIPIFADAINRCHNTLKPKGVDLLKIITDDDPVIFENILHSFVGIAAIQIGLTDILTSIGVVPDGLVGHSVGELGCAYADNCLTAEQMILSAYYRGKASLDAKLITGMMAAVGLGYNAAKKICPDSIEVACHNSSDSCTITGPVEDVKKLVEVLQAGGIFARLVNVSNIAYHSRYIKPAAPLLLSYLKDVIPQPKVRSQKWISTSIPQNLWGTDLAKSVSPEYLTNNLLSSVLFEESLPFIPNNAVLIEVAPHGLLQAILKRALPEEVLSISLTKRKTDCMEFLFNSLGELYMSGIDFNASSLYPEVPVPVPRGTRSLCGLIEWEHQFEWELQSYTYRCGDREKSFRIDSNEIFNITDNIVNNEIVVPFSMFFEYITAVVNRDDDVKIITMENIIFENQFVMAPDDSDMLRVMYQPGCGYFEVFVVDFLILKGSVVPNVDKKLPDANGNNKAMSIIQSQHFYKQLDFKGYNYPEENKLVSEVVLQENNGFKATVKNTKKIGAFLNSVFQLHLFNKTQSSQQVLLPKYIRSIHVNLEDFGKNAQDYSLWYEDVTEIIRSDCGVHVIGIEYEEMAPKNIPIRIENLKFVAHSEEYMQDVENGFNMLTKIIVQNSHSENLEIIELKEKHCVKYLPYFEKYLRMQNVKAKTCEINNINYDKIVKSDLTIISEPFLDMISQILPKLDSYLLMCLRNDQSISISKKYITIAHFCTKNCKFYLVKQANKSAVEIINIKEGKLSYKSIQTYPWAAELKKAVHDNKKLYVTFRSLPAEGIAEFIVKMQNISNEGKDFRFIFILDSGAPECKPESAFYTSIFEQDLTVQVLKDGRWGNFIDIGEIIKESNKNILSCAVESNDLLKICKPSYFGLHLADLTRTKFDSIPNEIGALDFTGINEKGQQIMGFGQFDKDKHTLTIDSEYIWPVPTGWTLHDAATVPYAYTLAYYSLFVVADLCTNETILIHGGTSEIGLAALHLLIYSKCQIYTTVETDVQRNYLKNTFHFADINILDSSSTSYTKKLLEITNSQGVQVILNCIFGKNHLEACKTVLSKFGRLVQLATSTLKQYNSTGMAVFMDATSLYGISGQHLLQLPQDVKRQLRQMVIDGIKNKFIQPLSRHLFANDRYEDGLRYLSETSSIGAALIGLDVDYKRLDEIKDSLRIIRSHGSYLIYADLSDAWLLLTHWLVENGAKRIVLANISNRNTNFVKRCVSLLEKKYNVKLIVSINDATTLEGAKKLVADIGGPLNEAFIFAMSEDTDKYEKLFEYIHDSLHQNKNKGRIVIFLGRNKEKSYMKNNGPNICNIAWNSACSSHDIIRNLEAILKKNTANIYVESDSVGKLNKIGDTAAEDLSKFLPSSLKVLKQIGYSDSTSNGTWKLLSHSLIIRHDVPPLFIVPSLSGQYCPSFKKFVEQLLHPIYCVMLPDSSIGDSIVDILAKQIISIEVCKVYRVFGISWGVILALEIAKKLESWGNRTEVFLIDGVPENIKSFSNSFFKDRSFDSNLLKDITKIDGESLKDILTLSGLSKTDNKHINKSLKVLKNHIEYSNFYKPLDNKIHGPVTVLLPQSSSQQNSDLSEHSEQFRFMMLDTNRRNILQSTSIIESLHEILELILV